MSRHLFYRGDFNPDSESDIIASMVYETFSSPTLFWPKARARDGAAYQAARKLISDRHGEMPRVLGADFDMAEFFKNDADAILYYPVFSGSSGWWGELLGGAAKVCEKISLSEDCALMAISRNQETASRNQNQLFAAEIFPTSGFFKKASVIGAAALDMLATESGTILALFSGKNQGKFQNFIESSGNFYLGAIGSW
jgi:hypothetical protein